MARVLIIDDDTELCELLIDYLVPEGFEVKTVHGGEKGANLAVSGTYDLVILDVMLPGMNGFDVLRKIRNTSTIPVLMLTARGDDVDRIVGLEMGADDYLPKPFNPRELVARLRAIQRRALPASRGDFTASGDDEKTTKIEIGDTEINPSTHKVLKAGEKIALTAVEFSLLHHLMKNGGQVVTRDDLAENVLGRKLEMFDRSIDVHISSLRKKLGNNKDERERIITIRGVGYQYLLGEKET